MPYFIFLFVFKVFEHVNQHSNKQSRNHSSYFFLIMSFFLKQASLMFYNQKTVLIQLHLCFLTKNPFRYKLFLLFSNQESVLIQAMATCHSLINFKGELTGNPLDVKLFEAIEWVKFNHRKEFGPTITFNQ